MNGIFGVIRMAVESAVPALVTVATRGLPVEPDFDELQGTSMARFDALHEQASVLSRGGSSDNHKHTPEHARRGILLICARSRQEDRTSGHAGRSGQHWPPRCQLQNRVLFPPPVGCRATAHASLLALLSYVLIAV